MTYSPALDKAYNAAQNMRHALNAFYEALAELERENITLQQDLYDATRKTGVRNGGTPKVP
jgi:hypothetical protein